MSPILQYDGGKSASESLCTYDNGSSEGTESFSSRSKAEWREVGTTVTVGSCMPIILCTLLTYADLVGEQNRRTLQSGEGEPSGKVGETADTLASFKPDVVKRCGFPASGNITINIVTMVIVYRLISLHPSVKVRLNSEL